MQNRINIHAVCAAAIVLFTGSALFAAESPSVIQAKNKLKQLDNKIDQLKKGLATAQDKHGLLNRELAENEKQIGAGIRKIHQTQQDINSKQAKITNLEKQLADLNKQLSTQQQLLAEHIRIRHKMGEYQPLKWVLNQEVPGSVSRLLTFHQYLVRTRQKIIDDIDATKSSLLTTEDNLKQEIANQKILQDKLHSNQEQLEHNKSYHTAVIKSLDSDIQNKQNILTEFEQNKKNLSQLLKTLTSESITYAKRPFADMRHKLPKPVHNAQRSQKMNQGITFFAGEGTPVYAVYPGKIVFSDWLNGYGLLLIIDHGKGFMTLYAHNQSLFKRKGTNVLQGEQITSVGHSGGIKQSGLYFEVRQRGKAVPPLEWLS